GIGTGTIIKLEKLEGNKYKATGLTALHVFFQRYEIKKDTFGFALDHPKSVRFYQGLKITEDNRLATVFSFNVEDIKVLPGATLQKDICLFTGSFKRADEEDIAPIEMLQKLCPKVVEAPKEGKLETIMYHYPLG